MRQPWVYTPPGVMMREKLSNFAAVKMIENG